MAYSASFWTFIRAKVEALKDHYDYRGLKLTDQVMKLLEQLLDSYIGKLRRDAGRLCAW